MKTFSAFVFVACVLLSASGCEDFVQNIEPPLNSVVDEALTHEGQVPFLVTGVAAQFNATYGDISVLAGALSDELIFDRAVQGATFPTLEDLDRGTPSITNSNAEGAMTSLGRLRLLADTLVARIGRIEFSNETVRENGLFYGYFYGGVARYFWASTFGLEQDRGGGVISNSPFIPSDVMYAMALERLDSALVHSPFGEERRMVYTLIARIHLFRGDHAAAETAARSGLIQGDFPFEALFSTEASNPWHFLAGAGRTQLVLDPRFNEYAVRNRKDTIRIKYRRITGQNGRPYYRQARYPADNSPIPFLTWQENALILAETVLRSGNAPEAASSANTVRAFYGLAPMTNAITLDSLYVERDKQLYCTGTRLADQRRFGKWHLPAGTWQYLPITQAERTRNPNLR